MTEKSKTDTGKVHDIISAILVTSLPPVISARATGKKKLNRLLIELNIEKNKKTKGTYLAVHSEGKLYPGCHIFWTAARLEFNIIYLAFYTFHKGSVPIIKMKI